MSESLWPCGRQHTRLPCPSLPPGVYSDSCLLSQWCHPTISSSLIPFSCLQSFPASESFPMGWLLSGGQSIGASALASVLPVNIQGWFLSGLTGLISLQSKGLSSVFSSHHSSKASNLWHSSFFIVQLSHLNMTTEKTIKLITGGITFHDFSMYPVLYHVPYTYFLTKCSQNLWVDKHEHPTLILIE